MSKVRSSLWTQSGQFWLGAFMVAELPVGIAITALPDATRTELLEMVLGNGWITILAVAVLIGSGLLVGSVAHRLGVGE